MRRNVADWSAAALAILLLAAGGIAVVKPAVDHWGSLYRADPFEAGTSTKKIEQRSNGTRTTIVTTKDKASSVERVLSNSGLLLLRLILVAVAAFAAAFVVQRAILGDYGLRSRPAAVAPGAPRPAANVAISGAEDQRASAPAGDGTTTAPELGGANLAPPIAKLIGSRREELGLSQRELAKRAGVSHTVVSRIEQGEYTPSRKTLERLADALRTTR